LGSIATAVAKERHQLALSSRMGDFNRSLSRLQRELLILGIALFIGAVVVPAIIWLVGTFVFGKYAGGNSIVSLYVNFFKTLAQGAQSFWLVLLGPYVLITVARVLVAVFRGPSSNEEAETPPAPPKRRAPPPIGDEKRTTPEPRRAAPQPNRAPPRQPPPPQPNRKSPQKPGERRTPFIKSID
jgi:hypothetical protein